MPEFPTIAHVTLTVRDLDRSVPWYQRLFGAEPVVDEQTIPFRRVVWLVRGQQLLDCISSPIQSIPSHSTSVAWASTIWPLDVAIEPN
jgi:catechol 2,3-dioxygenase-like lactoylglutathione lyase family enzyme